MIPSQLRFLLCAYRGSIEIPVLNIGCIPLAEITAIRKLPECLGNAKPSLGFI